MIKKYRKKPVVIEAIQLTKNNFWDCLNFCGESAGYLAQDSGDGLNIATLEGVMTASYGDYIIKGVKGEFYPCKPDIFEMTYEPIKEQKKEHISPYSWGQPLDTSNQLMELGH